MVDIMLINTHRNTLEITYKQKVTINKIRSKRKEGYKTYEYKEVNIPNELITYWKSILPEDMNTLYFVTYMISGVTGNFITPLEVSYNTDLTGFCNDTEVPIFPERIIPIPLRTHGKPTNPKYFIRHNSHFSFTEDYLTWVVNPYLKDPVLNTMGVVSVDNKQVLTFE